MTARSNGHVRTTTGTTLPSSDDGTDSRKNSQSTSLRRICKPVVETSVRINDDHNAPRGKIRFRGRNVYGRKRSSSAPARIGRKRHLLVEDHYRVDPEDKKLLPGLPVNDDDWPRDLHDFFNLITLVRFITFRYLLLITETPQRSISCRILFAMCRHFFSRRSPW